jgi:hypothetical protein
MKDLIILTADKSMEFSLRGALGRPASLSIRPVTYEIITHPGRDGGTRSSGAQLLRLQRSRFSHALMVFDHEGSGSDLTPEEEERRLDTLLADTWDERAKSIAISPELEAWMWGSDHALAEAIGWRHPEPPRAWALDQGFEFNDQTKPLRPKEALLEVFKKCRQQISASLYQAIASKISLARCTDPAFVRLRGTLQQWFPQV